jgi:uncharacterized Zn-binding protein involved in type VI secretion
VSSAARKDDPHACPSHGEGTIANGMSSVVIGGKPAARTTDPARCPGPPNAVGPGCPTVLIGGLQAARVGDVTTHGGRITSGEDSVTIGTGSALAEAAAQGNALVDLGS